MLSAMPSYFMSLFKVPTREVKCMEKITRDFLWDGTEGEMHRHVVSWDQVCKPKDRGLGGLEEHKFKE